MRLFVMKTLKVFIIFLLFVFIAEPNFALSQVSDNIFASEARDYSKQLLKDRKNKKAKSYYTKKFLPQYNAYINKTLNALSSYNDNETDLQRWIDTNVVTMQNYRSTIRNLDLAINSRVKPLIIKSSLIDPIKNPAEYNRIELENEKKRKAYYKPNLARLLSDKHDSEIISQIMNKFENALLERIVKQAFLDKQALNTNVPYSYAYNHVEREMWVLPVIVAGSIPDDEAKFLSSKYRSPNLRPTIKMLDDRYAIARNNKAKEARLASERQRREKERQQRVALAQRERNRLERQRQSDLRKLEAQKIYDAKLAARTGPRPDVTLYGITIGKTSSYNGERILRDYIEKYDAQLRWPRKKIIRTERFSNGVKNICFSYISKNGTTSVDRPITRVDCVYVKNNKIIGLKKDLTSDNCKERCGDAYRKLLNTAISGKNFLEVDRSKDETRTKALNHYDRYDLVVFGLLSLDSVEFFDSVRRSREYKIVEYSWLCVAERKYGIC